MARYGKEHKEATKRRIIETAGHRLKRDGIDGSGVSALMADAGLTNGAFYAHFTSKEDLVATTVADQLHQQLEALPRSGLRPRRSRTVGARVPIDRASGRPRARLPVRSAARRDPGRPEPAGRPARRCRAARRTARPGTWNSIGLAQATTLFLGDRPTATAVAVLRLSLTDGSPMRYSSGASRAHWRYSPGE